MLTPEEQAEYDALIAKKSSFGPPSQEEQVRGFLPRLGAGVANIPGDLMAMPTELLRGVAGLAGWRSTPEEQERLSRLRTGTVGYTQLDPAQNWQEATGDIIPVVGREVGLLALPASKAAAAGRFVGLGEKAASVAGQIAAGGLSGVRLSGKEAALQAGEFGLGQAAAELIPGGTIPKTLMRMAAQAAVPLAGQVARGESPISQQGLTQGAVQAGMQALADYFHFRTPRSLIKPRAEIPAPPKFQPSPGLAAELGLDVPASTIEAPSASRPVASEEDLFDEVFGGQPRAQGETSAQPVQTPTKEAKTKLTTFRTREEYERSLGRTPLPEVPSDINTPPEMQGDVFSGTTILKPLIQRKPNAQQISQAETVHGDVRPLGQAELPAKEGIEGVQPGGQAEIPAQKTQFVGTAINTPEGVVTGKTTGAAHPEMMGEAMDKGAPIETLESNLGFAFKKPDGSIEWVDRIEAGKRLTESGQITGLKPGEKLTSEHIRGEVPGVALKSPKELLKRTPKEALQTSMAEAKERLTAARAMGDADEIGAIESEIKVIGRAMRQAEEGKPKIPLKKPETRVMLPLAAPIRAAAGAGIGYMFGDTEEERMRNAILGGGGALLGPIAAKRLLPAARNAMEQAARSEMAIVPGQKRSLLGRAVRGLETKFNLGRAPETILALEKGKGKLSQLSHEVQDSMTKNYPGFKEGLDNPSFRAAGEEFLDSHGLQADINKLDVSGAPQGYRDALKAQMAAEREGQRTILKAEKDPMKRALIASTMGKYKSTQYLIDLDPNQWKADPVLRERVIDEWQNGPLRGRDREEVARMLDSHLAQRRNKNDPNLSQRSKGKVSQELYTPRMDLTEQQWAFIDQMSKDPRTPTGAETVLQQFYADKTIDPAGQQFLRALAGNKKLTDAERVTFRELADKEILTQTYRDLTGEIKDPFERQIYTINKLLGSVAQAQTINEIADTVLPTGLKMAMDGNEWVSKLNDPQFRNTVEGYVKLDDVPGYGKLAGKYVPRDVKDALDEAGLQMGQIWRYAAKANNYVKSVATAYNPTVHARQAIQSPLFLVAARVNPLNITRRLRDLSLAIRGGDDSIMRELREQHMTEANYSHQELGAMAKTVSQGGKKNIFKRAHEFISGVYGIPDDFVRISSYLENKPRYWKEAVNKGLFGDAAEKYARDRTTIFVNEHTTNYGQVPQAVKFLRNVPGISPFASYSAEILRITKNLAKDVAQGTPAEKIWGLTGLTTLYALPAALAAWGKEKFLTPEQQKKWDETEGLMPASDRSNLKVPLGVNKKGSFRFLNLNPLMPAGDMVSTVRNAARGDWESLGYSQPFFGLSKNPLASALVDVGITGEHGFIHEKLDEPSEKLSRVSEAVLPSWAPPSGFMFKRMMKSLTPGDNGLGQIDPRTGSEYSPKTLLQSMVGAGERTANPEMLQRSALYKQKEKLDIAESELKKVLRSGAPESQKEKAKKKFLLKRAEISEAMQGLRE